MLAHDAAALLAALRSEVEALMVDTCTIDRATGTATDAEGRVVTTFLDPPPYVGKCRIQTNMARSEDVEAASSSPTTQIYYVHVPASAGPFEVGDQVTVGDRVFRVTGTHEKTFQSARRLPVEEVST